MTIDPYSGAPESFEEAWPQLSAGLAASLRRDGVSPTLVEDIVQETGCRLLVRWDRLDPSTSMLPLALTIARNLVIDHHRRYGRVDGPEKFSQGAAPDNVESQALARVHLGAVHRSLREMTPRYRNLLLAEAGYMRSDEPAGPATRVARTRARQGLRLLLERRPDVAWGLGSPFAGVFRAAGRWHRAIVDRSDLAVLGQAAAGLGIFIASLVFVGGAPDISESGEPTERPVQTSVISDPGGSSPRIRAAGANLAEGSSAIRQEPGSVSEEKQPEESGSLLSPTGGLDKGQTSSGGGFGVHGLDEKGDGETSIMDEPVTWRWKVHYRNPQCVRRAAQGKPTAGCDASPEADAGASASYGDSEWEIDPDS